MSINKFLSFGKLLSLLLLISCSVSANTALPTKGFNQQEKISFNKVEDAIHKNMLQPQVVHVNITVEHTVKPVNPSCAALFLIEKSSLEVSPNGQTTTTLQDADRCESVSRLLFPFHIFW